MTPLVDIRDLKVHFPVHGGVFLRRIGEVKAVDGVSFHVREGETLGLVGESGCGKSTIGKSIVKVVKPTSGEIRLRTSSGDVVDLAPLTRGQMRPYRPDVQMIFQDPYSSLNPRLTVGSIVEEPLTIHRRDLSRSARAERVAWLLEKVGLRAEQAERYPHEFSGGQRQRIGIARALATNPKFIIADEPVSALDVSIQAQILNLLLDLQQDLGLTYLFIAHDLSVVEHVSDRIAVMYLGDIVEVGPARDVHRNPLHPYTRALLSAVPQPDPDRRRPDRIVLGGEVPSPLAKPSGCGFRTRCPLAQPECATAKPPLVEAGPGRLIACPIVLRAER